MRYDSTQPVSTTTRPNYHLFKLMIIIAASVSLSV